MSFNQSQDSLKMAQLEEPDVAQSARETGKKLEPQREAIATDSSIKAVESGRRSPLYQRKTPSPLPTMTRLASPMPDTSHSPSISSTRELTASSDLGAADTNDKFRVLICVEKHEWSEYAFRWALDFYLDPKKHRIYILTITKDSPQAAMIYSAGVDGGVPSSTLGDIHDESTAKALVLLQRYYAAIVERLGTSDLDCHCLIGQGDIRDEICQTVKKTRADLLILGQRGSGLLKRTFLGSTGDHCLHHAHCSVLVIKDDPLPPFNREHPDAIKNAADAYREAQACKDTGQGSEHAPLQ